MVYCIYYYTIGIFVSFGILLPSVVCCCYIKYKNENNSENNNENNNDKIYDPLLKI